MQEEIDYRKLVVRPKELEAVKEARAQGDLSENFEYKAAKQDKTATKAASAIWKNDQNRSRYFRYLKGRRSRHQQYRPGLHRRR